MRSWTESTDTWVASTMKWSLDMSSAIVMAEKPWPMCRHTTTPSSHTAVKNGSQCSLW